MSTVTVVSRAEVAKWILEVANLYLDGSLKHNHVLPLQDRFVPELIHGLVIQVDLPKKDCRISFYRNTIYQEDDGCCMTRVTNMGDPDVRLNPASFEEFLAMVEKFWPRSPKEVGLPLRISPDEVEACFSWLPVAESMFTKYFMAGRGRIEDNTFVGRDEEYPDSVVVHLGVSTTFKEDLRTTVFKRTRFCMKGNVRWISDTVMPIRVAVDRKNKKFLIKYKAACKGEGAFTDRHGTAVLETIELELPTTLGRFKEGLEIALSRVRDYISY